MSTDEEIKRGPQPGTPQAANGGKAVREKYGLEFFKQIGKKGGEAVKVAADPSFYSRIGKKGGDTTKEKYGLEHFQEIGRKGGRNGLGKH